VQEQQSMNQGRPNAEKRQIDNTSGGAEAGKQKSELSNCPNYLLSVVFIHLNANSVAFCLPSSSAPQVHVITFVSESNMHLVRQLACFLSFIDHGDISRPAGCQVVNRQPPALIASMRRLPPSTVRPICLLGWLSRAVFAANVRRCRQQTR
jgi:hypothetical protein